MRLKNLNEQIPHGFRYIVPATNFDLQRAMPFRSFRDCVNALLEHVRANRHVCSQSGLPTDFDGLAKLVEDYSAKQLIREGYKNFVMDDSPQVDLVLPKTVPHQPNPRAGVAAGLSKTVAGVGLLVEWLGSGGKPVAKELAEQRASVCTVCVHNVDPNWIQKLDAIGAEQVRKLIGMKNDMALTTSVDNRLNSCGRCDCSLTLKVHTPIEHVKKHTTPEVMESFPDWCWVKTECAA